MHGAGDRTRCVVVGGGVAGLVAASRLTERGIVATVLEGARSPGGRLATERRTPRSGETAVWDVGAQFLTCRDERFAAMVAAWRAAGIVTEWFRGLPAPDPPPDEDEPHYRGIGGMAAIATHLERGIDVRTSWPVERIEAADGAWRVTRSQSPPGQGPAAGEQRTADALVLATPVPIALRLLEAGGVSLPDEARGQLEAIGYEPTLAVLATADGPTRLPEPGAWHGSDEPIAWIADNLRKGLSDAPAVTVHAGPGVSADHLHDRDHGWTDGVLEAASAIVGRRLRPVAVRRWVHATPRPTHGQRTLVAEAERAPVAFAGDAFGGPRVEGAALSGMAAADALSDLGV